MRIMVVGGHPDDAEINAGGILAKNNDNHIAIMTFGELGGRGESPDKLKIIREDEARRAAKILNANIHFLGYSDCDVHATQEMRLKLAELIREIKPEIILTHDQSDNHPDHRETAIAVKDAVSLAGLSSLKIRGEAHSVTNLYTFGCGGSIYIDVSPVFDQKMNALRQHQSQIKMQNLIQKVALQNKQWGEESEVEYAELFKQVFVKALPKLPEDFSLIK